MTRTLKQDLNQWVELSIETFEGQGYGYEFVDRKNIQLKITEPS